MMVERLADGGALAGADRSRCLPGPPPPSRLLGDPELDVVAGGEPIHQRLRALRPAIRILLEAVENDALELRRQRPAQAHRRRFRRDLEMTLDHLNRQSIEDR